MSKHGSESIEEDQPQPSQTGAHSVAVPAEVTAATTDADLELKKAARKAAAEPEPPACDDSDKNKSRGNESEGREEDTRSRFSGRWRQHVLETNDGPTDEEDPPCPELPVDGREGGDEEDPPFQTDAASTKGPERTELPAAGPENEEREGNVEGTEAMVALEGRERP